MSRLNSLDKIKVNITRGINDEEENNLEDIGIFNFDSTRKNLIIRTVASV
jgi:hypothetical protein